MKRRSKKPRRRSGSIRISPSRMQISPPAINFLTAWPRLRAPYREASARKLEIPDFLVQRFDLAFVKGDKAEMERAAALAQAKSRQRKLGSPTTRLLSWHIPVACRRQGGSRRPPWIWLDRRPARNGGSVTKPDAALWEAFFGNAPEARRGRRRTRAFKGPGRGVWRGFGTGPLGGFRGGRKPSRRSGKALPGGYRSPIQLPAGTARTSGAETAASLSSAVESAAGCGSL